MDENNKCAWRKVYLNELKLYGPSSRELDGYKAKGCNTCDGIARYCDRYIEKPGDK